ncbi:MAG: flavin reductase family protein [Paracoccaceae bacterium]
MTTFDPRALRRAFGSFMTGVTVVTTRDAAGTPLGFTANSFTSVSLDPPLVLVCPGRFLSSYDAFATCQHFAVNVLAEGQEDVSDTFASFKGDRFAKVAHGFDACGIPLIDGAIAQFSCATEQVHDAGDHCLLIGRVEGFSHSEGAGLGYAGGRYFNLEPGHESGQGTRGPADRRMICGAIIEVSGHVLLEETQKGFRPPHIAQSDRTRLRRALESSLTARGLKPSFGAAYSMFDDATTDSAYILATADRLPRDSRLEAVKIEDLPDLTYTTGPIADMMTRYAQEAPTRDFSLYLGDARLSETTVLSKRN